MRQCRQPDRLSNPCGTRLIPARFGRMVKILASSQPLIRRALLKVAHARSMTFVDLFDRYLHERFLWRLSQTAHAQELVLKGAAALPLWLGPQARPTGNLDLQKEDNRLALDATDLHRRLVAVCEVDAQAIDGLHFAPHSMEFALQRNATGYQFTQVRLAVTFGRSQHAVELHVSPQIAPLLNTEQATLPTVFKMGEDSSLAGLPQFPDVSVRSVSLEQVLAEKVHILASAAASAALPFQRCQDLVDLQHIITSCPVAGNPLSNLIKIIFARRQSSPLLAPPRMLAPEVRSDPMLNAAWQHHLRSRHLPPTAYEDVAGCIYAFVLPMCEAFARNHAFTLTWSPGGPWGR